MKKIFYTLLVLIGSATFLQAQFNWQGVLRDDANSPVINQDVSVQISILRNGGEVFQETHSTTTSDLGIMTLEICNGTNVSGDCSSIDWSDGSYMINVAVDVANGSNYVDYGNSPILMVPMASYAATAGTAENDQVEDADADPTNEIQQLQWDRVKRELSIEGGTDTIRIPTSGGDSDLDPTNEIQMLTKNGGGQIVLLSNGGLVNNGTVNDEIDDADADPNNELQSIALNGTELSISDGNSVDLSGLGGGGSGIWTKSNQDIFYETSTPGNRIQFGPGNFQASMSAGQTYMIDGGSNKYSIESAFRTPNSGKQHAIGSYIQDFPVPDFSQMYMRMDSDTMFDVKVENFTGETRSTMTLAGTFMNQRAFGFQMAMTGGFGSFAQFVGNRLGVRMGILDNNGTAVPFVGIPSANNPNQIVTFLSRTSVSAPLKNFNMEHPEDPNKRIWYACIEGPEAAAYERGTVQLVNGEAFIPFSDHFKLVINPETMTVNLTPNSAESLGLAVVEKTATGIKVKELHKGTGNYTIDWEAKAVRKGYEDYRVIRNATESQSIDTINLD